MNRNLILLLNLLVLVAACDSNSPAPKPRVCADWTVEWSHNMPDCVSGSFNFPIGKDGVHIVVRPASKAMHGKTVTLNFSLEGDGELAVVDKNDGPPARVRLFVQNRLDDSTRPFGRWWSRDVVLTPGEHTLSQKLVPEDGLWSSVNGQNSKEHPSEFNNDVNQAGKVGFTFGGSFAAHGIYAKDKPIKFVIKSFTVDN